MIDLEYVAWGMIALAFAFPRLEDAWSDVRRRVKGAMGERNVSRILHRKLPSNRYRVFDSVLLRFPDGGTSQIDHIVVSQMGIFVIESKNYKGTIVGLCENQKWTLIVKGGRYERYSPIK